MTVQSGALAPITAEDYTNRYVEAATRSVPSDQRDDYAEELRSSIRDQIDARVEAGEHEAEAERATLTELGDPARLAADYAGHAMQLIGPRVYADWKRLLVLLLWIVMPAAGIGGAIAPAIEGDVGGSIAGAVLTAILGGLHTCFWVTLVFAVVDRAGASTGTWSVDALPMRADRRVNRGEMITGFVFAAVFVLVAVWDGTLGFIPWGTAGGEALPILHPVLWPWSPIVIGALLGATAVFELVVYVARRRGLWFAIATTITTLVGAALVVVLVVEGLLINPAFVEFTEIPGDAQRVIGALLVIGTIGLSTWGIIDAFRRVGAERRGRR